MTKTTADFALYGRMPGNPSPVLLGVEAKGRLDGTLFELTLRQRYRNDHHKPMEVVYTFPVPIEATLLGFASELNGVRQTGHVVPERAAERRYERALDSGDAPVMLQRLHGGSLFNASIGNLNPGDEIVLEVRFAQLLRFDQGRLRLSLPSTIAPRYGDPLKAHLEPQQVPPVSLDADYPLSLEISIGRALHKATVHCPTHPLAFRVDGDGTRVFTLTPEARLDRDFVLMVTPEEARPSVMIQASDHQNPDAPVVVVATFQPPVDVAESPLNLKLLVDCSGSMNGDSIASARRAVLGVVGKLQEDDTLSLTRFGTSVDHLLTPTHVKPQTLRFLQAAIAQMAADLGGTEIAQALRAVCELTGPRRDQPSDILLISDGHVWQVDEMLAQARASGHRIFAIGVGNAPAQGLLRTLAEASGGACEFAAPGEALEEAAQRMLRRMRQRRHAGVHVDWGQEPAWTNGPSSPVFGDDSIIVMAGFEKALDPARIGLLATDDDSAPYSLARCETHASCPGDALARLAAAARLKQLEPAEAQAFAVRYQLVTDHTHCILVHERADLDKVSEASVTHRVSHMLAAGWGGTGISLSTRADAFGSVFGSPSEADTREHFYLQQLPGLHRLHDSQTSSEFRDRAALAELRARLCQHLANGGGRDEIGSACSGIRLPMPVFRALMGMVGEHMSLNEAWQILGHWIVNHGSVARRNLITDHWIAGLDSDRLARCLQICAEALGGLLSGMPSKEPV